jgi:hypothetical protein
MYVALSKGSCELQRCPALNTSCRDFGVLITETTVCECLRTGRPRDQPRGEMRRSRVYDFHRRSLVSFVPQSVAHNDYRFTPRAIKISRKTIQHAAPRQNAVL